MSEVCDVFLYNNLYVDHVGMSNNRNLKPNTITNLQTGANENKRLAKFVTNNYSLNTSCIMHLAFFFMSQNSVKSFNINNGGFVHKD